MSRPNFCPHCGHKLPDGAHGAQGFTQGRTGDGGWDCYCDICGWSGDILPDEEASEEVVARENGHD